MDELNDEKERDVEEQDEDLADMEEEVAAGVNSAISDSPAFWNAVQNHIIKTEKTNLAAAAFAKELVQFYSSAEPKKLMKAKIGWSQLRNLLMESAGVEYHKYAGVVATLSELRSAFDDKMNNDVLNYLGSLAEKDLDKIKAMKNNYDQLHTPYLSKMKKFLGAKIESPADMQAMESERDLVVQRKVLDLRRVDLGTQVENMQTLIRYKLLKSTLECLKIHYDFFLSGRNLLESFEKNIKNLEEEVSEMKAHMEARDAEIHEKRREIEDSTSNLIKGVNAGILAAKLASPVSGNTNAGHGIRDLDVKPESSFAAHSKEGYLYMLKTQGQNFVQKRMWCVVDNGKMSMHKKKKMGKTVDLLLCTVKEARETHMRYAFQLISPSLKLIFQACSQKEMEDWISVIQKSISIALNSQPNPQNKQSAEDNGSADLKVIQELPENRFCADCGFEGPDWSSKNLGIMICKSCSGIHRSLGTHISKVRSVTLDKLDKFLISFMREHGNKGSNALFLAEFDQKLGALPTFQSPRSEIEKHITLKYKEKKWMKKIQGDLNLKLFEACKTRNWIEALECIFQGANVNFQNLEEEGRTILHEAVNKVDVVMSVLLIENGAALDLLEERGWNPLHYAAYRDCAPLVELLLLHRSPLNAIDQWGFDPLNLAMKYESNSVIELLNKAVKKADVKNQGTALSALRNSGNAEAEQAVNNERAIDGALKGITEGRKTKIEKFFTGIFKKDKE